MTVDLFVTIILVSDWLERCLHDPRRHVWLDILAMPVIKALHGLHGVCSNRIFQWEESHGEYEQASTMAPRFWYK